MNKLFDTFYDILQESNLLKKFKFKKIKMHKPHYLKMNRGLARKTLSQVSKSDKRHLSTSNIPMPNPVNVAKKSYQGIWPISPIDAINIARKYRMYLPDPDKPQKHLSTTGIVLIRNSKGQYFLIKSPRFKRKSRRTSFSTKENTKSLLPSEI
jgi:hypothetical protein